METPNEKAIRELKTAEDELDFVKAAFEAERAKRRELEETVDKLIEENYSLLRKYGPRPCECRFCSKQK